jgi:transposase
MDRLEQVSADELRTHLDKVDEKRPTLRLVVGINYKEGLAISELANWYGLSRTTVYNWLDRFERLAEEPFDDVIYDADRPGRPTKLNVEQWHELVSILEESPTEVGIDAPNWSANHVQIFIDEEYGVEYSRRHVRELLNRAGFRL